MPILYLLGIQVGLQSKTSICHCRTALDNLSERLPKFSLDDLEDILDDNPIEDILGDAPKKTHYNIGYGKNVVQTLMFADALKVSARFLDYAAIIY